MSKFSNIINSIQFNQPQDCFSVSQNNTYSIYQSDPIKQIIKKEFTDQLHIHQLALHYHTSLIAFVASSQDEQNQQIFNKNTVIIYDDSKDIIVGKIKFRTNIYHIQFRKDCLIVQLHCQIYIYNLTDLELIDVINISDNHVKFSVSQQDNDFIVAYCMPGQPDKVGINFYLKQTDGTKIVKKYIDKLESTIQQLVVDQCGQICVICTDKFIRFVRCVDQSTFGQMKINGTKIDASIDQTADYFGFLVNNKVVTAYIIEVPQIKQIPLQQVDQIEQQQVQVQKLKESIKINIDCTKQALISMQKTLNTFIIITDKNHYEKYVLEQNNQGKIGIQKTDEFTIQ